MAIAAAPTHLVKEPVLLIGDRRLTHASGGTHQHVYAGTGEPTAAVPLGGVVEMDAAVRAARTALPRWRAMPADVRRDAMLRAAELIRTNAAELSFLQTLESAVPTRFARTFPAVTADFLAYHAGWIDKIGGEVIETWPARAFDYAVEEPYGVVAVVIPWNGPLVSIGQTVAPALAAGNTVVLKPPELAPFTAVRVGELFLAAGFPPGVLNVVPGGPDGGAALVGHPGVDKVHFTGGGDTARRVLAATAASLTPVGLELGGKSAHLIFADADPRVAARQALSGLVILSGQGCANGTRVLVESPLYDEVLRLATTRLRRLAVGDPFADDTTMGPVISESACERILAVVGRARADGSGRLVTGGERLGGDLATGYFVAPTIFGDVAPDSELAQREIFGPVLSFLRFDGEEEAVRLANGTEHGLAAYVHTNDLRRAHRVARALEAGSVWVNGFAGISPATPFGGTKRSGYGRVGGRAGIREFTRPKNVWLAL
jgi:acyl-CoA reductase-like NAD-dependent aldehyde dehydrogenase